MKSVYKIMSSALLMLVVGCAVAPPEDPAPALAETSQALQSFNLGIGLGGHGFGSVTANPVDDNFRSGCVINSCTLEYVAGTPAQIVLTASPLGVSTFSGWQSCPHPSGSTCTVDNNTPQVTVAATFACTKPIDAKCKNTCFAACLRQGGSGGQCSTECSQECNPCLNG